MHPPHNYHKTYRKTPSDSPENSENSRLSHSKSLKTRQDGYRARHYESAALTVELQARNLQNILQRKKLMNMERALRRDRIFAPVLVLVTVELANSSDSSASKETIPWQIRR
jgi:hypothetical protein